MGDWSVAKVRARKDNGMLFLDFYYRRVRCREQTAMPDTAENRRRVQALMNRIAKEIKQGTFDYASTFPNSPRAAKFQGAIPGTSAIASTTFIANPANHTALPTFAEFSVTWRSEMAPQWRRLHRISVDAIFDAHLLPAFGNKTVAEISKADVLAFRADLVKVPGRANATLSPSTVNKTIGILRQCMAEACDRNGLQDVFKGVKRLKANRPDVHPFSLEEVERIQSTIRVDYRAYVTVRFFTGMRTGEINGLKWKYVDIENEQILIRETYSAGVAEENAKTQMAIREIPMLPMVKEALERQWEDRNPDSDYVFCTRDGNPVDAHNFANRVWYPLLRFLEIDKRRPYQTRHTTATLMLASGENPEWIARLMGHANTQMLFTVYSRFVPNLTRQDGLAITGLLSKRHATGKNKGSRPELSDMSRGQLEALVRSLSSESDRTEATQ